MQYSEDRAFSTAGPEALRYGAAAHGNAVRPGCRSAVPLACAASVALRGQSTLRR